MHDTHRVISVLCGTGIARGLSARGHSIGMTLERCLEISIMVQSSSEFGRLGFKVDG